MKFAPDEAKWFWPTYEQYVNELVNMNNAKYALITHTERSFKSPRVSLCAGQLDVGQLDHSAG